MGPINLNIECDSDCKKWCPRKLSIMCCCCSSRSPENEPVAQEEEEEEKESIIIREEAAVKVDNVAEKVIKKKRCIVC